MPSTHTQPLTQEAVWETVLPIVTNQSEQLVQIVFLRYKLAFQMIKREMVEEEELQSHPSLSPEALKTGYMRVKKKEQALSKAFKEDLVTLRALKEASVDQPRCHLIVDEAKKTVLEIKDYMVHHSPTSKEIAQDIKNLNASPHLSRSGPSTPEYNAGA